MSSYIAIVNQNKMKLYKKKRVILSTFSCIALVLICVLCFGLLGPSINNNNDQSTTLSTTSQETTQSSSESDKAAENSQNEEKRDNSNSSSSDNNNEQGSNASTSSQDNQSSSGATKNDSSASVSTNNTSPSSGQQESAKREESSTISISVIVTGSGYADVSGGGTFSLSQGASAYDALKACNMKINASNTQYGIYVSSIEGLAEKEHGSMSGWLYAVNGQTPNVACSTYKLKDGDEVKWFYIGD